MAEPLKKLFTVSEYHSMAEAGILSEEDRVELIEGEIYRMAPIGSRHAGCVTSLIRLFAGLIGERMLLYVQNPVDLGDSSESEPDVTLLRFRNDHYASSHPTQDDVLLLVEVADTSIRFDRNVKLPAYARNGIPEFWLVDLTKNVVEVYRQPSAAGFRDVLQLRRGDRISSLAFPDLELNVSDILV